MTHPSNTFPVNRMPPIVTQLLPYSSGFYGLIMDQCTHTREMIILLETFVQTGEPALVEQMQELETRGEELRVRNLDSLNPSVVCAADREDFLRACHAVDELQGYLCDIVVEMDHLGIKADWHMLEMTVQLRHAVDLMCVGFQKLTTCPIEATHEAELIFNLRKSIEKSFRAGLVHLVSMNEPNQADLHSSTGIHQLFNLFKRREIYQLFREASLKVGSSGKVLHEIALQFK
ncbi:MAG: hypothetical protein H7839_23260 [Magnetococcus sp. YQC-5]